MKKLNLFAGIAVAISGLFASQTFAASGCVSAACDPAAAAAACDPVAVSNCSPNAPVPPGECDPGCLSATCASPACCDPAVAAACKSGCGTGCGLGCGGLRCGKPGCCDPGCGKPGCGDPGCGNGCGACSACGKSGCDGHCGGLLGRHCGRRGCANAFFGKILEGSCWSGYMNAGYFTNFKGDRSNGYVDCWGETTPAFNALYLSGVKKAYTGGCGYDFGWGMDFMFGEDARLFRSVRGFDDSWVTGHMGDGRDSYGFAMPQLYMEMAINNWTFKVGHFFGLLGYEGATANSRFFYTKGLLCSVSPVAQTGALATYNGFQNLDLTLGWINGWGNGFDNSEYGEGMIEGAFTYHMNEYASVKYAFLAGDCDIAVPLGALGPIAPGHEKADTSVHTVTIDLQLTSTQELVGLMYYGDFGGKTVLVFGEHLYQDLDCCTKAGFRAEWMKYNDGGDASEMLTMGIGLNYHPNGNQNLFIRPELRYDKTTNAALLHDRVDQFTIGFDVMMTF